MTTTHDKAKVKALKLARQRIESKQVTFICYALSFYPNKQVPAWVSRDLCQEINRRLGGSCTVENWLYSNVPAARELYKGHPDVWGQQVRLYRLRWIDALIMEYGGKP